jgi:hypothetical protein
MAGASIRRWLPRVGIVLIAGALMAQDDSGCDTETKNEPDQPQREGSQQEQPRRQKARLGDPITLEGFDGKLKMRVATVDVADALQVGEFDEPQPGMRFVGVVVAMRNVGSATYDDAPGNGAKIITTTDEQADATIGVTGGQCGGQFISSTTISPGSRRVGCIPFEIRQGQRPKLFQFSLESGFGPQSGEWRLR